MARFGYEAELGPVAALWGLGKPLRVDTKQPKCGFCLALSIFRFADKVGVPSEGVAGVNRRRFSTGRFFETAFVLT